MPLCRHPEDTPVSPQYAGTSDTHAYGTYNITSTEGTVLIIELISPGTTLDFLPGASLESIRKLESSAKDGLAAIHQCKIALNDVYGRNMVI